jgi:ABC-type branched-subunit amino acid transport system ATPase component
MLVIEGLTAGYGGAPVLHGVGLHAAPGKVTCVMGRNGAGKTTLMRAIMGQLRASRRCMACPHMRCRVMAWRWCRRGGGCSGR